MARLFHALPFSASLGSLSCYRDLTPTDTTIPSFWTRIIGTVDANLRIITHLPVIKLRRDDGYSTTKRREILDGKMSCDSSNQVRLNSSMSALPKLDSRRARLASRRNLPN